MIKHSLTYCCIVLLFVEKKEGGEGDDISCQLFRGFFDSQFYNNMWLTEPLRNTQKFQHLKPLN